MHSLTVMKLSVPGYTQHTCKRVMAVWKRLYRTSRRTSLPRHQHLLTDLQCEESEFKFCLNSYSYHWFGIRIGTANFQRTWEASFFCAPKKQLHFSISEQPQPSQPVEWCSSLVMDTVALLQTCANRFLVLGAQSWTKPFRWVSQEGSKGREPPPLICWSWFF